MDLSVRVQLVVLLGGKCTKCDISDPEMLQLDHIADDGRDDLERFGNLQRMYLYYLKRPDEAVNKLQVLCANHNWKKRYEAAKKERPAAIEIKPQEPKPKIGNTHFEKIQLDGDEFIVWKGDHAKLIPGFVTCPDCQSQDWQLIGEMEPPKRLFLRCANCGYDHQVRLY